ncbi:hypothetical protein FACS1894190_07240 [Spirochaetia bacterium]|nr:hypothetical protein FACS1894190_07240 [Spirochaetia bacterium]
MGYTTNFSDQLFQNYNPNRKTSNGRYRWYFTKTQTKYSRGLITFESKSSFQWYLDRIKEADGYAAKIGFTPCYPTPSSWSRL